MSDLNTTNSSTELIDCFIIMPIADPDGYDKGHFNKVYEDIIQAACRKAGFRAVRADEVKQTNLIHLDILQKLIDSPMAVCDLSNRNPNVLFELGLRQAFDKPTVLIQECGTPKIFDISPLRYTEYRKELKYREVLEDQDLIADALKATKVATDKGEGINSIVGLLSLASPAQLKEVTDTDTARMMQVIMSEMNDLKTDVRRTVRRLDERNHSMEAQNESRIYFERAASAYQTFCDISPSTIPIEQLKHDYDKLQLYISRALESRAISLSMRSKLKEWRANSELIFSNLVRDSDI